MSTSTVLATLTVTDGEIVTVSIRQERQPRDPAGIVWKAPRGLCRILAMIRAIVRMECEATRV